MLIPLRTDRPNKRTPIVTQGLIVANLAVYLFGLIGSSAGMFEVESLARWGHFNPRDFKAWQLVTSLFLHDPSSIWHLAFNMLFLWVFGASVEDRVGRSAFLLFYLMGGCVAALAHAMISQSPIIGASGAIAAVTGAFLALFPRSHMVVLYLLILRPIVIPSAWFIGLYFVIDVLRQTGELLGAGGSNVAYMAHIAGYLFGFTLAFLLLALNIIRREEYDVFFLFKQARRRAAFRAANRDVPAGLWDAPSADTGERLAKRAKESAPPTEREIRIAELRGEVNRLASAHDLRAAAAKYRDLLRIEPDSVFSEDRQLELANQLYADHDHPGAAAAYELMLERYPKAARAGEIRLILGVIYARQLNQPQRAREVIEAARPALHEPGQTALANQLLAELSR